MFQLLRIDRKLRERKALVKTAKTNGRVTEEALYWETTERERERERTKSFGGRSGNQLRTVEVVCVVVASTRRDDATENGTKKAN
jgi:hypothetical protein